MSTAVSRNMDQPARVCLDRAKLAYTVSLVRDSRGVTLEDAARQMNIPLEAVPGGQPFGGNRAGLTIDEFLAVLLWLGMEASAFTTWADAPTERNRY